MTIKQFKKELHEFKKILNNKELSFEEKYPVLNKLASKCPRFAEILQEEKEYYQKMGYSNLPLNKRVDAVISDSKLMEFELESGRALMECWDKFDSGDFKHDNKTV